LIEKYKLSNEERELLAFFSKKYICDLLRTETEIIKILDHPGISRLIESFETKTHQYIILELVQGKDFFEYITSNQFLEGFLLKKIIKS
jgi:serine/threonine protein kinase